MSAAASVRVNRAQIRAMSMPVETDSDSSVPVPGDELVLRRGGRDRVEQSVLALDQPVEAELRGSAQQRPAALAQEISVLRELVMLPEVLAQPDAAHHPDRPGRVAVAHADRQRPAPHVGVVVRDPAARVVELPGDVRAVVGQPFDQLDQRLVARRRARPARRPSSSSGD